MTSLSTAWTYFALGLLVGAETILSLVVLHRAWMRHRSMDLPDRPHGRRPDCYICGTRATYAWSWGRGNKVFIHLGACRDHAEQVRDYVRLRAEQGHD